MLLHWEAGLYHLGRMSRKAAIPVALILVVAAGVFLWPRLSGQSGGDGAEAGPGRDGRPPTAVTTLRIEPGALSSTVIANGTLRAMNQITVQPETSGRIVELHLRDGARVEAGDLLVRLDSAPLQAELAAMEAERDLAARTFQRQEELVARNAVTQEAFDSARSRLNQLEAQVELIRVRIERNETRAPFGGRLGLREVSLGAYVGPGDALTTLQSEAMLQVDFSVPERYQERIQEGAAIQLEVRGVQNRFTGRVVARAPMVDRETRTLRFRAEVPNEEGRLLPGNFARVTIPLEEFPDALLIPATAVLRDEASAHVFLVEDGRAMRRDVSLGIRTREEVQIVDGLRTDDVIIIRGGQNLSDGSAIRIVEEPIANVAGQSQ